MIVHHYRSCGMLHSVSFKQILNLFSLPYLDLMGTSRKLVKFFFKPRGVLIMVRSQIVLAERVDLGFARSPDARSAVGACVSACLVSS